MHAAGSDCHACMKGFSTRTRLLKHLRRGNRRCLATWVHMTAPLSAEDREHEKQVEAAQARALRARGLYYAKAETPVYPIQGPAWPPPPQDL
eukprot:3828760-Pyramimonas_sp.AAC.1